MYNEIKGILGGMMKSKLSIFSYIISFFFFLKDAEGYISEPVTKHIIPFTLSLFAIIIILLINKNKFTRNQSISNNPGNENIEDSKKRRKTFLKIILYVIIILFTLIVVTLIKLNFSDVYYLRFTKEVSFEKAFRLRNELNKTLEDADISCELRILPRKGKYVVAQGFLSERKAKKYYNVCKEVLKNKHQFSVNLSKPASIPFSKKIKYFSVYNLLGN